MDKYAIAAIGVNQFMIKKENNLMYILYDFLYFI